MLPQTARQHLVNLWGFSRFLVRRYRAARCPQVAASLTYTTLLALVPLLTIGLLVFSILPAYDVASARLQDWLINNLLPDAASKVISVYLHEFANNAGKLTLIGIGALVITAGLTIHTIDHSFNDIWQVPKQKRSAWFKRAMVYWSILTLTPLLLGISLSVSSTLYQQFDWQQTQGLSYWLLKPIPIILLGSALSCLYIWVPRCYVPTRDGLCCGFLTAIALYLQQKGFGWYIGHFSNYTLVYGAFASLPIFLIWLYTTWFIVLAGAVICAALPYWQGQAWKTHYTLGHNLLCAIQLLLHLRLQQQTGQTPNTESIQKAVKIGYDQLHNLLHQLQQQQLVHHGQQDTWTLARAPQHITLKELYHLLVMEDSSKQSASTPAYLQELESALQAPLTQTLEDMANRPPKEPVLSHT